MDFSTHIYAISSGLLLGMRHGLEWDHLAAIFDMTSTVQSSRGGPADVRHSENFAQTMSMTGLYALGHGFVVIVLGLLIQKLSRFLPHWLDQVMEKVVGATLVILGIWTIYSLCKSAVLSEPIALKSRWALIFHGIANIKYWFARAGQPTMQPDSSAALICTPRMAFGIGMIHGIGVETSTQIILLSTASSMSHSIDCWVMLLTFVCGLVFSNSIVALFYLAGALTAASVRPLYLILGTLTGLFSVAIGALFIFSMTNILPELSSSSLSQHAFGVESN